MPIVGYSPWTDAANYGQGVGNALSESLLQLPMQRYQMAVNAERMRNAQQLGLGRLGVAEQRINNLQNYQQGQLGLGQDRLQQQQQASQLLDAIRMLQVQNEGVRNQIAMITAQRPVNLGGGNIATLGGQEQQTPQLPPMPSGAQTNQMGAPMQQQQMPQQQQAPQLGQSPWSVSRGPQGQMTPNQDAVNKLALLRLYGLAQGSLTNNTPQQEQYLGTLSNMVYGGQSPQQPQQGLGQTNRVFNYNPQTGQLE